MIENCYGTGTVHWSDDSYAQGSYACPGCSHPKCPAKTKEAHVHDPRPISNPSAPSVALTVSIPVKIGGYTGQRDEWEESTYEMMAVTVDDDGHVIFRGGGSLQRKVSFPRDALEAALRVLAQYDANAQPKPVTR